MADLPNIEQHPDIRSLQLATAASGLHDMYAGFVQGGFTERQALTLVALVIVHGREAPDG